MTITYCNIYTEKAKKILGTLTNPDNSLAVRILEQADTEKSVIHFAIFNRKSKRVIESGTFTHVGYFKDLYYFGKSCKPRFGRIPLNPIDFNELQGEGLAVEVINKELKSRNK